MAKHKTVAIEFSDLIDRIGRDTNTPWREVIGLNHEVLDSLVMQLAETDLADTATLENLGREIDQAERQLIGNLTNAWWVVSWPEHVTIARYNSDANYARQGSEAEAVAIADAVYGR